MCSYFLRAIIILIAFLAFACDGGLSPRDPDAKSFLKGKIVFLNHLPTDSVKAIRAAAFKKIPDSSIINDVLAGNAYFNFESLSLGQDTVDFSFEIVDAPVKLFYIAAVMQYDTSLFSQRVVGVYTESGDKNKHSSLTIERGRTYNIKIEVDYNNLPPNQF